MDRGGDHRAEVPDRALGEVEFDDLLREVLSRVQGVLDEQARLRLLLDAVVTMAADLTLDGVLARIVSIASTLVDAQYAALGVLDVGPRATAAHLRAPRDEPDQVAQIGDAAHRPRAAGSAHRRAEAASGCTTSPRTPRRTASPSTTRR